MFKIYIRLSMQLILLRLFVILSIVLLGLTSVKAGTVTINIAPSGANVVATASGSITVPAATTGGTGSFGTISSINGPSSIIRFAGNNSQFNTFNVSGCSISGLGSIAGTQSAFSSSGPLFQYSASSNAIFFPAAVYSAGDQASVTGALMTFRNKTIAALGLNVGTYTCTWINNSFSNTLVINVLNSAPSTDATLSSLVYSSGALTPTFASGTISYTQSVANSVSSITVTPTVNQANATVTVNGTAVATGVASGSIPLNVGSNTITTVVTAQDGTTTKTYTTSVTRAAASSGDATLSSLVYSSGALTPTFASGTISYTQSVANSVSSITVTPTVNQANATVTVNGTAVATGVASGSIPLNVGSNTITTVVTAQDGTTTKTYTTSVTRETSLAAQASFAVVASPNTLNSTTTTSSLSSTGGSGTGLVSFVMTSGSCSLSGTTVTAGSVNETCTVTATKAADSSFLAATATVNIVVSRRASISSVATDASVAAVHGTQMQQAQKFATTQLQHIASHLDSFRHNFELQPSNFGFGINSPLIGQLEPVYYKLKEELTYRLDENRNGSFKKVGHKQSGDQTAQATSLANDFNNPDLVAQPNLQGEQQNQYIRKKQTYSLWTAGTIDVGTFRSGDNKETTNKFRVNGLTMGIDYKIGPRSIIGAAIGYGQGENTSDAFNSKVKSSQKSLSGYGMWGFGDNWIVDGLVGYADMVFVGDRTTSDGLNTLSMKRNGYTEFGSISLSKVYIYGKFKVSPFLREDLIRVNLGQYNETGAADQALGYDKTSYMINTMSSGIHFGHDTHFSAGKLITSAKISANQARTGSLSQDIYFADTGSSGDVFTFRQLASYQYSTSLNLGLTYVGKGGDSIEFGWMGAVGANQYRHNGIRLGFRFAI